MVSDLHMLAAVTIAFCAGAAVAVTTMRAVRPPRNRAAAAPPPSTPSHTPPSSTTSSVAAFDSTRASDGSAGNDEWEAVAGARVRFGGVPAGGAGGQGQRPPAAPAVAASRDRAPPAATTNGDRAPPTSPAKPPVNAPPAVRAAFIAAFCVAVGGSHPILPLALGCAVAEAFALCWSAWQ